MLVGGVECSVEVTRVPAGGDGGAWELPPTVIHHSLPTLQSRAREVRIVH